MSKIQNRRQPINVKSNNYVDEPESQVIPKGYKICNYYWNGTKDDKIIADESVMARAMTSLDTGNTVYLVKMYGGELFDPNYTSISYNRREWLLKKTNENVFKMYLAFIINKGESYKLKAERMIDSN